MALKGQGDLKWLPTGGWRANWPDLKFMGYMDPEWKGLAWAPLSAALAKRRVWVVEGVPKDKYYLYGRIELYIDKVSYQGAWNRKFNWNGELLNTLQTSTGGWSKAVKRPDGRVDYMRVSNMAFQCAESIHSNRATVAGIKSDPKGGFDFRVPFPPAMFDMTSLARSGK
jgi:hypothetical protein